MPISIGSKHIKVGSNVFSQKELGPLLNIALLVGAIGKTNGYGEFDVDPAFETLTDAVKGAGVKGLYAKRALQAAAFDHYPLEVIQDAGQTVKMVDKYWDLVSRGKRIDTTIKTASVELPSDLTITVDPVLYQRKMIVSMFSGKSSLIIKVPVSQGVIAKIFLDPESLFFYAMRYGATLNGEWIIPDKTNRHAESDYHEDGGISKMLVAFRQGIPYSAVTALDS
jgi:hypothetical protein